jgi:hypothetical protein
LVSSKRMVCVAIKKNNFNFLQRLKKVLLLK